MPITDKRLKSPSELLVDALIYGFLGFLWVLIKIVGGLLWLITSAYRTVVLLYRLAAPNEQSTRAKPLIDDMTSAQGQPAHR